MAEPTQRIVLHKLQNGINIHALDFTDKGYRTEADIQGRRLFVQTGHESEPAWKEYVKDHLTVTPENSIVNSSCSFILLVSHGNNNYALTGGHGHLPIKPHTDARFGLEVVLRMLDEVQITAIHQRNLKGSTRQIFRAVVGYNPLLDDQEFTRILRSLEGKPEFEGKRFRVVGRSSLTLRTARDLDNIGLVLQDIEQLLQQQPKVTFPRAFEPVRDQATIDQLDALMSAEFSAFWNNNANRDRLYVEFIDPLIQFRSETFKLTYRRREIDVPDFDLTLIRERFQQQGLVALNDLSGLRRLKVTALDSDGNVLLKAAAIEEMLVCEVTHANANYIRLDGEWLRILEDLQGNLDQLLAKVQVDRTLLPSWDRSQHPKELNYNTATAASKGWACLDQQFIQFPGYSKLELCDQYNQQAGWFIHAKETWGAKSSYLFAQGLVAAKFFKQDTAFRESCIQKWPNLFDEHSLDRKHTVVFGIAANNAVDDQTFPRNMTYFAKLTLCDAILRLRDLEYEVMLAPIRLI